MRATIADKREVAKGTLFVVFDLLGQEVDFRAGQYFWVTLLDPPYDDEKGPRRHISVVTSPNERGVLGLCTRLRDSAFKRSLAELPVGTEVDVEHPKGDFLLPDETDRPYVFLAGGIGITVFRCMLRYVDEEELPHRITLVYSNPALPAGRDDDGGSGLARRDETDRAGAAARPSGRGPGRVQLPRGGTAGDGEGRRVDARRGRDPGGASPLRQLQRLLRRARIASSAARSTGLRPSDVATFGSAPRPSRSRASSSSPFCAAVWSAVNPPAPRPFGSAPASRSRRASGAERTNAAVPSGGTCAIGPPERAFTSAPRSISRRAASSCLPKTARWRAVKPSAECFASSAGSASTIVASRSQRPKAAASNTVSSPSGGRSARARSASPAYSACSASLTPRG